MTNKMNAHGVRIEEVSTVHKSFSKSSCIPASDITPAVLENWQRQRADAMVGLGSLAALIPMDVSYAGCWMSSKLRAARDTDGKCLFDDDFIRKMGVAHGRKCFGNVKNCWKIAAEFYADAMLEKQDKTN